MLVGGIVDAGGDWYLVGERRTQVAFIVMHGDVGQRIAHSVRIRRTVKGGVGIAILVAE